MPTSLLQRFESHVQPVTESGCWLWTGSISNKGYGKIWDGQARSVHRATWVLAHRVAWELYVGPIPSEMNICHKCDVRPCVRPDHLFLGSFADNSADMRSKGRANRSGAPSKIPDDIVREIRSLRASGLLFREIAEHLGVSRWYAQKICTGKRRGQVK